MRIHLLFDLLAWSSGGLLGLLLARSQAVARIGARRTVFSDPVYFITLACGAVLGALVIGSANLGLAGRLMPGHSIAGALVGGVIAVELLKLARGTRESTGGAFVAPLALGIAVGRLGCFFAGLPDFSYGTPTDLPWGVDFGDGVPRHPVQLYESLAMLGFLIVYLRGIATGSPLFLRQGFYLFVGWYGVQRFAWEFLKPYPTLVGPLNLFHFTSLAMIAYSLFMIGRTRELHPAV
jgi:phosphatidylglycerol:prolipoprotein diacylglycerol transferase